MELNFAAREIKTWRIVRFSEFLNKPTEQLRTEANEQHPHQNTDGKSVHVRWPSGNCMVLVGTWS